MTRGRHVDYDSPRAEGNQEASFQSPTAQLIRALVAKDQLIEVARVPTHILDEILHAEPIDAFLRVGSVDVTRVNLTQLRALVRVLEGKTEKMILSRWQTAEMGPVASVDLSESPPLHCHSHKQSDIEQPLSSPSPIPDNYAVGEIPMDLSDDEKENAVDEPSKMTNEKKTYLLRQRGGRKARNKKKRLQESTQESDASLGNVAATIAAATAAAGLTPRQCNKLASAAAIAAARRSAAESKWDCRPTWNSLLTPPPPPPPSLSSYQHDRSTPPDYRTTDHWAHPARFSAAPSASHHHQQPVNYSRPRHEQHEHSSLLDYGRADSWMTREGSGRKVLLSSPPRQPDYYQDTKYYGYH